MVLLSWVPQLHTDRQFMAQPMLIPIYLNLFNLWLELDNHMILLTFSSFQAYVVNKLLVWVGDASLYGLKWNYFLVLQ